MRAERRERSCIIFTVICHLQGTLQGGPTPRQQDSTWDTPSCCSHLPRAAPQASNCWIFCRVPKFCLLQGQLGSQGGRKHQEPKAGDGRRGREGLPAAHWAVPGIKTAPDLIKIIRNCAVTSQKQKNEEFKVAKCGLARWNILNSLMLPPSTASPAAQGREGKGSWTSCSRKMQDPLPTS